MTNISKCGECFKCTCECSDDNGSPVYVYCVDLGVEHGIIVDTTIILPNCPLIKH